MSFYKKWYKEKYGEQNTKGIENVFHLRRCFLHADLCGQHALTEEGSINLLEQLQKDQNQVGGIDGMLMFDIGYDPKTKIRCGNRKPVYLTETQIQQLNEQLEMLEIPAFLYFDPYLADVHSDWDQEYREKTAIRDRNQEIYRNWGNERWHPCLMDEDHRRESEAYLHESEKAIHCSGIYLDEIGNGNQYTCGSTAHAHGEDYDQISAEAEYTRALRSGREDRIWMCEYPPADCYTDLFDIVLSDTRTPVNIYRFLFPEKKFIRIIGCDLPLGDNYMEVNKSFFNGEGLWIDGDTSDPEWYPEHIRQVIQEQYAILKKYASQFSSDDAEPLVECGSEKVLCNAFSKGGITIKTFLNVGLEKGTAFIPVKDSQKIHNLYHGSLERGGDTCILHLDPGDVGCILIERTTK